MVLGCRTQKREGEEMVWRRGRRRRGVRLRAIVGRDLLEM